MRKIFDHPFIPITSCFIVGLILASVLHLPIFFSAFACIIVSLLLLIIKRRPLFLVIILMMLFGVIRLQTSMLKPDHDISHFIDQLGVENIHIKGKIIEESRISADGEKVSCIMKLTQIEGAEVQGNILLTIKNTGNNELPLYGETSP